MTIHRSKLNLTNLMLCIFLSSFLFACASEGDTSENDTPNPGNPGNPPDEDDDGNTGEPGEPPAWNGQIAACSVPQPSKTYYYCGCGAGSDAACQPGTDNINNDPSNPMTPGLSYDAAQDKFGELAAGEMIAFCRGGAFQTNGGFGDRRWANDRCTRDEPCVVGDYTPDWANGAVGKPIIASSSGHGFTFQENDTEHEEGYLFLNLDMRASGTSATNGFGFHAAEDISDVEICNVDIDSFHIGVHLDSYAAGQGTPNTRFTVRRSTISNSDGQGLLGHTNDLLIEGNTFSNNGYEEAIFNHNIYLSGSRDIEITNVRVVGNTLYQSAVINGECQGVSLVVHGKYDGILIEGNTVYEDVGGADGGCWGISVDPGYDIPEYFRNVVIRGNTVINVGRMGIGVTSCEDCLIENNVVIHDQPGQTSRGIRVPSKTKGAEDFPDSRITVRNNSVLIGGGGGAGVSVTDGTGHQVVNNAIQATTSTADCFNLPLETSAYDMIDYNICNTANGGEWVSSQGNLNTWQNATPFDEHSQQVDPRFQSPATYDLSPQDNSPLINAGTPGNSPTQDIDLSARDDGMPDVGAYEHD